MSTEFKGVYAVAVTPFKENGEFDFPAAKAHVDYLIENGVHGIVVMGATSEYLSVTDAEHKAYVCEIVPHIAGRVPAIVGCTRERPDDVIDLALNAKKAGAQAVMVLPPYYCHPSQQEVIDNYKYIAEKIDFPIMAYNNPGSCGIELDRETLIEIGKIPQVKLVKESSGTIQKLTEVMGDLPSDIACFCGCDSLPFESFAVGSPGWISMMANVAPKDCVALFNAVYEEKNLAKGMEIYRRLLPGLKHLESFPKPVQSLKYIITKRGGVGGFVRRPRQELTAAEKDYVVKNMQADSVC